MTAILSFPPRLRSGTPPEKPFQHYFPKPVAKAASVIKPVFSAYYFMCGAKPLNSGKIRAVDTNEIQKTQEKDKAQRKSRRLFAVRSFGRAACAAGSFARSKSRRRADRTELSAGSPALLRLHVRKKPFLRAVPGAKLRIEPAIGAETLAEGYMDIDHLRRTSAVPSRA